MKTMSARHKRWAEEVESTAALTAAGLVAAYSMSPNFFESVKEGIKQGRHAGRTVDEMVRGTEGQRAVESLLEQNLRAKGVYEEKVTLVDNMKRIYDENELLAREAKRLEVQLSGLVVNATAAGDEAARKATWGLFGKLDDKIMNLPSSSKLARDGLQELQEIYKTARQFYDGREKSENTIAELCGKLEQIGLNAVVENRGIENDLNSMATQLDRTYKVEDGVFKVDDKVSLVKALMGKRVEQLRQEDVRAMQGEVKDYRQGVDNLRASVEQNAGIGPYKEPMAWLDYGINPVSMGIAAALVVKGASKLLPSCVEKPIRKALALPVSLAIGGTKSLYHGAGRLYSRATAKELKDTRGSK
jgi:hypothetical protein